MCVLGLLEVDVSCTVTTNGKINWRVGRVLLKIILMRGLDMFAFFHCKRKVRHCWITGVPDRGSSDLGHWETAEI